MDISKTVLPQAFAGTLAMLSQGQKATQEAHLGTLEAIKRVAHSVGESTDTFREKTAALEKEISQIKSEMRESKLAADGLLKTVMACVQETRVSMRRQEAPVDSEPFSRKTSYPEIAYKVGNLCDDISSYMERFGKPPSLKQKQKWLIKLENLINRLSEGVVQELPPLSEELMDFLVQKGGLTYPQECVFRNGKLSERLYVHYLSLRKKVPTYDASKKNLSKIESLFIKKEEIFNAIFSNLVSKVGPGEAPPCLWSAFLQHKEHILDLSAYFGCKLKGGIYFHEDPEVTCPELVTQIRDAYFKEVEEVLLPFIKEGVMETFDQVDLMLPLEMLVIPPGVSEWLRRNWPREGLILRLSARLGLGEFTEKHTVYDAKSMSYNTMRYFHKDKESEGILVAKFITPIRPEDFEPRRRSLNMVASLEEYEAAIINVEELVMTQTIKIKAVLRKLRGRALEKIQEKETFKAAVLELAKKGEWVIQFARKYGVPYFPGRKKVETPFVFNSFPELPFFKVG